MVWNAWHVFKQKPRFQIAENKTISYYEPRYNTAILFKGSYIAYDRK